MESTYEDIQAQLGLNKEIIYSTMNAIPKSIIAPTLPPLTLTYSQSVILVKEYKPNFKKKELN